MGMPGKPEGIDGADIEPYFLDGRIKEIAMPPAPSLDPNFILFLSKGAAARARLCSVSGARHSRWVHSAVLRVGADHIGRENTMFIAFLFEGIGIYALLHFASDPFQFVLLSGLVFFAWGEIYSLFPATCTDIYGRKFATTNYGMLYTAKGTAALLVPLGNVLTTWTGSWTAVFVIAAFLNILQRLWRLLCCGRCDAKP
jgi:hypothetical protein